MRCPKCNSDDISVLETRSDDTTIRRRRGCQNCNHRFSTYERIEYALPMVIKKDGRREVFRADKLRIGLTRACEKRPVSTDKIDSAVETIERQVSELGQNEINSKKIGELVMQQLKRLDKVAYVRFASVYKEFSKVDQFFDALEDVKS